MKKLLLTTIVVLGFTAGTMAQTAKATTDTLQIATPVEVVTIESISAKIDTFIESQTSVTEELGEKINRANRRLQDLQNESSLRWLLRDLVPLLVMALIGGFLIFLTYILTSNNYRNNQLKYDAMLKCADRLGSVPDYFNKVVRVKSETIPTGGRVHLVLSVLCAIIGTIFTIVAIAGHWSFVEAAMCSMTGFGFIAAAVILFIQYNRICEDSRKEQ